MKPRLTVITLGVDDLERAVRFYRDGLGLATPSIVGRKFEYGAVAFFDLQPGLKLAVHGPDTDLREAVAKMDRPILYAIQPGLRSHVEAIREHLAAVRFEVFEGAGHALFVDAAERFNAVLEEFIRDSASQGR